jgi:hypothetical protein
MINGTTYRAHRPLTVSEMTTIRTAIDAASSTAEILVIVVSAVFTCLLAPLGESLAGYGPDHQLDPGVFAIPEVQWATISEACMARADAFGGRMQIALELINVMPASYDDPSVTADAVPAPDQRPYEHNLTVSREATDVIATASWHCAELGRYFGEDSRQYHGAVSSWQQNISQVFSMAFGAQTRISRDGDLSLLVCSSSGFTYGIIFHPERRRCLAADCKAVINDDGSTWTYCASDPACADGQHTLSYPLNAPHPGTWSFHS